MEERETVRHEYYLGNDVRSSPIKVKDKWKVRVNVTYPAINQIKETDEHLDEQPLYATQAAAQAASLERGRRMIDQWLEKHHF